MARTWTCRQDGKTFSSFSAIRKHYWKDHRDILMRRFEKNSRPPTGRRRKNPPQSDDLSARDLIEAVKVKRDLLNEIIAEWEKLV